MKKPEEIKIKNLLASIREKFHTNQIAAVQRTPSQSHLADAVSKAKREIVNKLKHVLAYENHSHLASSSIASSDTPWVLSTGRGAERMMRLKKKILVLYSSNDPAKKLSWLQPYQTDYRNSTALSRVLVERCVLIAWKVYKHCLITVCGIHANCFSDVGAIREECTSKK